MLTGNNRNARHLFDVYARVCVVNLPARNDRRREMTAELKRLGIANDPRLTFFPAIAPDLSEPWRSRGERGCFLSHLAILRTADAAGQSVLILEDDCDFTDAAGDSGWGRGTDIFYGGFGAADYSDLRHADIQGSHCMGFSRGVLPELVQFLEQLAEEPAPPPIDGAYVRFRKASPRFQVDFALPQVAVQRQSPSDIAPGRFDRSRALAFLARIARRLNRRRYRRLKMMEGVSRPTN